MVRVALKNADDLALQKVNFYRRARGRVCVVVVVGGGGTNDDQGGGGGDADGSG